MTKEEAIEYQKAIKAGLKETGKDHPYRDAMIPKMKESCEIAIKALEQEPCEDCVKRQAVKEWLDKWDGYIDEDIIARMQYRVIDIPNALQEPKTGWIPVSKRLPEEIGTYMTTVDYGKYGLATGQRFYHGALGWEDDCVIAWMPLPEPYKVEVVE